MITVEEARTYYSGAESAHDFDHVLRVLVLAERLAREENADLEIVRIAALLHDISRSEEDLHPGSDHAEMAAFRSREILLARNMDPARVEKIVHAIATHRFRTKAVPQTLEAKILSDADKLDSIGAIGVARAFAVSGALNQRLWSGGPHETAATRDQRNSNHSAVAEFAVKLSHVPDRIFTPSARRLADERHAYMADFFARLELEVRGEA